MKKRILVAVLLLTTSISVVAQEKLTLEEIWSGAFRTKGMNELNAMKNSNQYTILNSDRAARTQQIDLYDYATLSKTATLIDTKDFKVLESIDSYTFDHAEKKILIATNSNQIFRRSFTANYFVFDIASKKLSKFTEKAIQEPTFSPDGTKVAYAFENNLYVFDFLTNKETQITTDGKKNSVINGITDWVYEEEFAFVRAFDWNANSTKIGYIRFDETNVPEFSMDMYLKGDYPTQTVFKISKSW